MSSSGEDKRKEVVGFWLNSANDDWEFAVEIWKSGKRLYNALFFAQMALEKTLKALHYYKKDDHPLLTHDLVLLAKKIDLDVDPDLKEELGEITSFNVSARYDNYKKAFRLKATGEYTDLWMEKVVKIRGMLLDSMKG